MRTYRAKTLAASCVKIKVKNILVKKKPGEDTEQRRKKLEHCL